MKRTTRLDRRTARAQKRDARKTARQQQLAQVRSKPVSGKVMLLVVIAFGVIAAGAWWANSLMQASAPDATTLITHEPTPSPRSSDRPATTAPPTPVVDREDPDAVVAAWAEAYLVRADAEDPGWVDALDGFTTPDVVSQLEGQAFQSEQILDGKAPTTLAELRTATPGPDGVKGTPVRWSRTVTAVVAGGDGSVTTIDFAVLMMDTDAGWTVYSVEELAVVFG